MLLEVAGRTGAVLFWHSGPICVNEGVTFGLTATVNVAVVAHWPAAGVNVEVVVAVLLNAGDQLPVIPLLEVVGKVGAAAPLHIAGMAVNVGVIWLVITISIVAVVAH